MHGKALDHMMSNSVSFFKLRNILTRDDLLRKKQKPLRTEKSSTLSLIRSDS